jgi:hypothetical protein
LESKVYVGVSAGSMIFSRKLTQKTGEAFGEHEDLRILGGTRPQTARGGFSIPRLAICSQPDTRSAGMLRAA